MDYPSEEIKEQAARGYAFLDSLRSNSASPLMIVAPMVEQSELAFRILTRRYGAHTAYTPMINAKAYLSAAPNSRNRREAFDSASGEEGSQGDRPLVIQFCGNDSEALLKAAREIGVEQHCDAVDLNLGCPQDIARRGHYGAWLMDPPNWGNIAHIITTLSKSLSVPFFAKFRVFESIEKTVEYAKMLERAGACLVACHGRRREQRGQASGLASLPHIAAVKRALTIPVLANGNVLFHADLQRSLDETGADGVMSAEGILYNPALFRTPAPKSSFLTTWPSSLSRVGSIPSHITLKDLEESGCHPPHTDLAREYLDIVLGLKTMTTLSAVKGHLFKILRPALCFETDLRERLGRISATGAPKREGTEGLNREERDRLEWDRCMVEYREVVDEMAKRMITRRSEAIRTVRGTLPSSTGDSDQIEDGNLPLEDFIRWDSKTGLPILPMWVAQPYFRGSPSPKADAPVQATTIQTL